MALLYVIEGVNAGQQVPLVNEQTIMGRSPTCDVVFPHAAVSRQHARIIRVAHQFYIEDMDTPGGTWLNGQQIRGRTLLQDYDRISFCGNVLEFRSFTDSPAAMHMG